MKWFILSVIVVPWIVLKFEWRIVTGTWGIEWGVRCWFLHGWELKKDNGFTKYYACKKCPKRKAVQPDGAYQPLDMDWLNGHKDKM